MIVALVTNLLLVLGLSIVAVLAARFVKRPGVLHGIWLLLLLRLFVPPLLQVGCLPSTWFENSGRQLSLPPVEPTPAGVLGEVPAARGLIEPLPGLACGVGHLKKIEERLRMIMKNRSFEVWT